VINCDELADISDDSENAVLAIAGPERFGLAEGMENAV